MQLLSAFASAKNMRLSEIIVYLTNAMLYLIVILQFFSGDHMLLILIPTLLTLVFVSVFESTQHKKLPVICFVILASLV